jgi:excisionase family DNA binding protein
MDGGLWDIGRLAHYLGIKRSTVYTMIERKEIPHYRIGRLARFRQSEIDEWLANKRCQTEAPARRRKVLSNYHATDARRIVQKVIDQVKLQRYTCVGESDHIKGLGKEG